MSVRSLCVDYPRGSRVPIHTHSWPQLLHAGQGTLRARSGENLWVVPPRRALWIPAFASHELSMLGPVNLRTLYFRKNPWENKADVPRVLDVSGLLNEMILRTCELGWLDERVHFQSSLVELLVGELVFAESQALYLTLPEDPRALQLATRWLEAEGVDDECGDEFAAHGMSRRTAERIFVRETGLAPARWRRLALLSRGLASLSDGQDIDAAAEISGYRSRSGFFEAFTQTFGIAPSEARPKSGEGVSL